MIHIHSSYYPKQFFLTNTKKGPLSKMGERWLQVMSYDGKVEMFSEELKKNLMMGCLT